ncbi:13662_t:CDS:2, partial [Entrophospora sp. SA101]
NHDYAAIASTLTNKRRRNDSPDPSQYSQEQIKNLTNLPVLIDIIKTADIANFENKSLLYRKLICAISCEHAFMEGRVTVQRGETESENEIIIVQPTREIIEMEPEMEPFATLQNDNENEQEYGGEIEQEGGYEIEEGNYEREQDGNEIEQDGESSQESGKNHQEYDQIITILLGHVFSQRIDQQELYDLGLRRSACAISSKWQSMKKVLNNYVNNSLIQV